MSKEETRQEQDDFSSVRVGLLIVVGIALISAVAVILNK